MSDATKSPFDWRGQPSIFSLDKNFTRNAPPPPRQSSRMRNGGLDAAVDARITPYMRAGSPPSKP